MSKSDGTEKFGDVLREIREENQQTQESMGMILGLSTKTISRWELGETLPDKYQRHGVVAKVEDEFPGTGDRVALSLGLAVQRPVAPAAGPNKALLKAALDGALFEATELLAAPPAKVREAVALVLERVALTGLDLATAAAMVRGKR